MTSPAMRRIWPFRLAQVVQPHEDGTLSVLLEDSHYLGEIVVRVARPRAHPAAGAYALPEVGDWGVVAFTRDDMRTGAWLGSLDDRFRNLVPEEVWSEDVRAELRHHPGDQWTLEHGDGTSEHHWPDGSHLRLSTTKDGTVSNTGLRGAVTERLATRKVGPGESERAAYAGADRPPVDVEFRHSSGATVRITADGTFQLATPKGHAIEVRDATEKSRDPDTGAVISAPEEAANRVVSAIELTTEVGHSILLNDDPVLLTTRFIRVRHAGGHEIMLHDDPTPNANKYVRVTTAAGHMLEARDLPAADQYIRLQTLLGHKLELRDTPTVIATVETPGGRKIEMDDDGQVTRLADPVKVEVVAPAVVLGDGGGHAAVARVGDAVQVSGTDSGGDTINVTGTITGGSAKVDAS